jgi:hypothetical protein
MLNHPYRKVCGKIFESFACSILTAVVHGDNPVRSLACEHVIYRADKRLDTVLFVEARQNYVASQTAFAQLQVWGCGEKRIKEASASDLERGYELVFLKRRSFPIERKLNGVSANL